MSDELPRPSGMAETLPPEDGSLQACPSCLDGYQFLDGAAEAEVRCYDCFGSGERGGGMLSMHASRALAMKVECPKCGAGPGRECCTMAGVPIGQRHAERHRRAVAVTQGSPAP